MKTKFLLTTLLSFSMLCGCSIISGSSEPEPDYSMYEWGNLELSKSAKKDLYKFENAETYTYTKEGKIFVKCVNGDYVYGKSGDFKVFSKTNNYAYFDCGSNYTYNDFRANKLGFYKELATYCNKKEGLTGYLEGEIKEEYSQAVSLLNTKLYSYYVVDTQVFTDGIQCLKYVAYDENFISDFVMTGYSDDENHFNSFYVGLNPIKNRISKYIMYRSSGHGNHNDHENEITFSHISALEAKTLHDAMISCGGEVSKDTYSESSTNFETKVKLDIGKAGVEHGGKLFSTSMKITYKDETIFYTYAYSNAIAAGTGKYYALNYMGEVFVEYNGETYEHNLVAYGAELTPVMPQTNENYIKFNKVD